MHYIYIYIYIYIYVCMYFLYKPNGNLGLGATTSIEYSKATHFAMLHHLRGYLAKVIEKNRSTGPCAGEQQNI